MIGLEVKIKGFSWRAASKVTGVLAIATALVGGCTKEPPVGANGEPVEVRVGYFPNVTHAQALIGMSRGDFQQVVGPDVKLTAQTFNAGPSAIEAVYAGHVDIAYVGPAPVLNGFLQSKGEEVRVIAGSATNGVTVVGNKARGITTLEQLKGGRVATPQYGNTQDISARYFLTTLLGAKLKSKGGETDVFPISNPDIETLFVKDEIDGAWVPEPWGSRLIGGSLVNVIEEEKNLWPSGSFAMTSVIARRKFLEAHPVLVSRFLQAHVALTSELQEKPQAFVKPVNAELKRITTKSLPEDVVASALERTGFDVDPSVASYEQYYKMGKAVGTIKAPRLDTEKLFVMEPLAQAMALMGSKSVGAIDEETTGSVGRPTDSATTTAGLTL
jgi:NitT/TauT family transport system substrate-binding protein